MYIDFIITGTHSLKQTKMAKHYHFAFPVISKSQRLLVVPKKISFQMNILYVLYFRCAASRNHVLLWLSVSGGQLFCIYDILSCLPSTCTGGKFSYYLPIDKQNVSQRYYFSGVVGSNGVNFHKVSWFSSVL